MRNPHDSKTNRSLAIVKLNQPASSEMIASIAREIKAYSAICVSL
jgi:hypothetical protein